MLEGRAKLKDIAGSVGHVLLYVLIIIGIPFLLLLPSAGINYPAFSSSIGRAILTVVYGGLTLAGLAFACVISSVVLRSIYNRIMKHRVSDQTKQPPIVALAWWSWGAALCWLFVIVSVRKLIHIWTSTAS